MQVRKQHIKNRLVHVVCVALACSSVCCSADSAEVVIIDSMSGLQISGGKADAFLNISIPVDFPAAQDLAVIFPLRTQGGIRGDSQTVDGRTLLPQEWIEAITAAYADTVVEDAIQRENQYEDWRLVSVRFAPCGPLGHHFGQSPETLCWPQVRLVWQPIMEDLMVLWTRPFFGDDRAIHALYHVMPESGAVASLTEVQGHLERGGELSTLPVGLYDTFIADRNAALERWIRLLLDLRTPGQPPGKTLDVRTELNTMDTTVSGEFTERLNRVLSVTALAEHLFDLTSFSLPEGRDAPQIDLWSFVAFDMGADGELQQRTLLVRSPVDGRIIGDAGLDETVTMTGADDELASWRQEGALAEELTSFVVFSADTQPFLRETINDPQQVLVPNTSCASCHRLNETRFDFHMLSHLEDNDTTIAPRVVNDVRHELQWLRNALGR